MGESIEEHFIGERNLSRSRSAKLAAERAYKMAGITNPAEEIDIAEISARFASQEPIICEALGLFPDGSGAHVADEGLAETGGKLPVCKYGGALGAYPLSAAGPIRIAECALQLTSSAGEAQVPDAKIAVAHGQDAFCAQHNAVMVLSRDEE